MLSTIHGVNTMDRPLIVLNFKTYTEGTGSNAVVIAQACRDVAEDTGANIVAAPQLPDIHRVASSVDIPVFSQHMDGVGAGSFTGHIMAETIKEAGATGTLINHSERSL